MNGEREKEIRAAVEQIGDPLWPGLTESDWCSWVRDLLAALDEERERADKAEREAKGEYEARREVEQEAQQAIKGARERAEVRASSWEEAAGQLAAFAVHRYGCMAAPAMTGGGPVDAPQECTCGLDEALAGFRAKKDGG